MPNLEFILLLLVSFQISALAHYLISKLSENSVMKGATSLVAATSSILILKPILEHHLVPVGYRTWFGIVVIVTVVLSVFVYVLSWVRGELEGEGAAYKTSLFARVTIFFLTFSLFVSSLIVLARTSLSLVLIFLVLTSTFGFIITKRKRKGLGPSKRWVAWEVDYYLIAAFFFSTLLLFLAPKFLGGRTGLILGLSGFVFFLVLAIAVFLRKRYFRYRKHSDPFESISYPWAQDSDPFESSTSPSHLMRPLSRIALVRVVFLALIALPVFFVAGTLGRVGVSAALVIYVAVEGLVIYFQLRIEARAIHLLHRMSP